MFVKLLYFLRGTQIAHELWRDILKRETALVISLKKTKINDGSANNEISVARRK